MSRLVPRKFELRLDVRYLDPPSPFRNPFSIDAPSRSSATLTIAYAGSPVFEMLASQGPQETLYTLYGPDPVRTLRALVDRANRPNA